MSMLTPEDEVYCSSWINDVSCSTRAAQGAINADLSCGRGGMMEEIQGRANGCAVSEGGEFCTSALTLFDLNGIQWTPAN